MTDGTSIKALALGSFDVPPSVIDVPTPRPASDEVLVRLGAASINAYDAFVAMGMMRDFMPYEFPAVIGQDLAGAVEEVGEGVRGFEVGDRVFGTMGMKSTVHDGSFGELATPQAEAVAHTPPGVDDELAGTLGVAGTTAISAVDAVDPGGGGTLLIVGATGGVGSFAVQLAAARGARVIATARSGDEGFVSRLGAADAIDYSVDLSAAVRARFPEGIDALIDLVNRDQAAFATVVGLVRAGGKAASAVGGAGDETSIGDVAVANVGGDPSRLDALAELVAEGTLRPAIRRRYPLADAAQALTDFTNEHTLGKLVITVPGT